MKPDQSRNRKVVTPWTKWITASRQLAGMEQVEFARYIGRTRSTLANYESGASPIPPDVIAAIKTNFPESPPSPDRRNPDVRILGEARGSGLLSKLPYAGTVPASSAWGDPLTSTEPIEIEPKFVGPNRFVAKVAGDSCYPALKQGDLTVWEIDESPTYGLIVLAERLTDQACTVKELRRVKYGDELVPVNPDHTPPPNDEGWKIRAKLIGVTSHADGIEEQWFEPRGLRAEILKRKREDRNL